MLDDLDDTYVPLDEAAARMDLTEAQVLDLVERKALRAARWGGWGQIMVQPAILNVEPRPVKAAPRKAARASIRRAGRKPPPPVVVEVGPTLLN